MIATEDIIVFRSKDEKMLHDARWDFADWLTTGYNWLWCLLALVAVVLIVMAINKGNK